MKQIHFNRDNLSFALANISAHKFRSFLTVLGIIVGIVTVILVASILTGVRRNIVELFREFGPDNIFVFHLEGDPYTPTLKPEEVTRKPLKVAFANELKRSCRTLGEVAAQVIVPRVIAGRPLTARYGSVENQNVLLEGGTSNFARVTDGQLRSGRVYTEEEEQRRAKVCVLGANIADSLFPAEVPLGKNIIIDNSLYRILGVFEKRKGSFFGENRQDNVVMIPAATILSRYPQFETVVLYCQAKPGLRDAALPEVEAELRRLRGLKSGQETDFHMSTADQIIQQLDRVTALIRIATLAVSGLGLLVGGVGVMNIMLMSVTQRTREIGVRKAIGARRRDIVWQFLLEAMLLTVLGGISGVALAAAAGLLISLAVPSLPAIPPLWAVLAGLLMSAMVGIVFGVWPAVRAARLDPIEALRYE